MVKKILAFVFALAVFIVPDLPGPQKRIYLANDDHTDYMWTADVPAFRDAFLAMLDYYLDLADSTAGKAEEFRSRFNPDGTFWIREFEKNRTTGQFERLIERLKDGSIGVPITLLNLCYGGMPAEAVLRSMYYAGRLERRYGLDFSLAAAQENQTLPFGVGTLWAGAGADYFWKGICGCASRNPDAWDRPHDMYWWTGLDGSRLLVKWNSMIRGNYYDLGGYAEARDLDGAIGFVSSDARFQERHPYDVIGIFGYGGDDLQTLSDAFVLKAESASSSDRKLIVSNIVDFFKDFETAHGAELPAQSVTFGNEWDILSASMAEVSARVKRATEKLRPAEAMAALVGTQDAQFMRGRESAGEAAWVDLGMYYDHDWTADGPITRDARAAWQRERAAGIETYVNTLYDEAKAALGAMIAGTSANPQVFVFNALGWIRTGEADIPYSGSEDVRVVDSSNGMETPSQLVQVGGSTYLRIWAEDVPSIGYKTFEIIPGAGTPAAGGPTAAGDVLENNRYRVQVGTNGAIISLIDKLRGHREMVRPGDRRCNDLGPGGGTIVSTESGPVSATLKVSSSGPLVHTTSVTIFRDSARIDIRNEIQQNFGDVRTWDFNVDLDSPDLRHEEIGAVILGRLTGNGGQYADQAARYDWLSLNHFADLSAGGNGLTISSPDLSFFRRGDSGPKAFDTQSPRLSILAGGQVDGSSLGIPNQGGDAYFLQRFALETHGAYAQASAMRFALEHQNPFAVGEITGGTKYPGGSYSLFSPGAEGVFVWAVKPAEDTAAGGIVVRLWNQRAEETGFSLEFPAFEILEARKTSLIETPIEAAAFQAGTMSGIIAGFGWQAYHLKLNGDTGTGKGTRKKIR